MTIPKSEGKMAKKQTMGGKTPPKAQLRREIDENLKRVFQSALDQDVPDRFKKLLEQLKAKEGDD